MKYTIHLTICLFFCYLYNFSSAQDDFMKLAGKSGSSYFTDVRNISEINSTSQSDAYPWISADGLRVYYTKGGTYDVFYFASRPDTLSHFTKNVPLTMKFKDINMYSIWLSDDELEAYYILYKPGKTPALYYSDRATVNDDFSDSVRINLTGKKVYVVFSPSLTKDRSLLYAYNVQKNGYESTYIFKKADKFNYQLTDSLRQPKNTFVKPGQLSKNNSIYYLGLQAVDLAMPDGKGKQEIYYYDKDPASGKFKTIANKLDIQAAAVTYYDYYQPSLSLGDKYIVFVSNSTLSSTGNDLYFGFNPNFFDAVSDNSANSLFLSNANPMPVKDFFNISYNLRTAKGAALVFYNSEGALIKKMELRSSSGIVQLSASDFAKGVYFFNINTSAGNSSTKKLIVL